MSLSTNVNCKWTRQHLQSSLNIKVHFQLVLNQQSVLYIRSHISDISWGNWESQIHNLTSDVTVTSFQMKSTPNLNTISVRYSGSCVQSFFRFSLFALRRYRRSSKGGGNYIPLAAGGWRGGPAAAGLRSYFDPSTSGQSKKDSDLRMYRFSQITFEPKKIAE